ncbi:MULTISPECIES: MotE family protein [unclassified Bradyrhizobium]|uniref:MotE family protein n=1 Tax=unclassified Bradyrhizobium TaxID=2631580 RepID=UPI002011A0EE|nr:MULTISPECIES: MotE family protein [unclassified Bradyrhizobium]
MARMATLPKSVLLWGCLAIVVHTAAVAEPVAKPSQPLNLSAFAKGARAAPVRSDGKRVAQVPAAAAMPAPVPSPIAQSDAALTTSSIAGTPANADGAAVERRGADAAEFCRNISDAALDARVAWQREQLEATEAKLRERIAELEAKRAEYEKWLKLREDFLKRAEDSVVEIYSGMAPDAAALQIASMADDTAAAVLAKLKVRSASAILNEMDPGRAAHLADTLAGMRRPDDGKTRK